MWTPAGQRSARRVGLVQSGMSSASQRTTSSFFVQALGERIRRGLRIETVATSNAIEQLARAEGSPRAASTSIAHSTRDRRRRCRGPQLDLLKGSEAHCFRERSWPARPPLRRDRGCVEACRITRADRRVPVEVLAFGWRQTADAIERLGFQSTLRVNPTGSAIVTDNGNYVLDVRTPDLIDAASVGTRLKEITGVIEHGLFVGMADVVLVGHDDGSVQRLSRR